MDQLNDLTFIIPLKIDSEDRLFNIKTILTMLNFYTTSEVMITEVTEDGTSKLDFLSNFKNLKITHFINQDEVFHRTRYLNEMLFKVKTPYVANYDADVFFKHETYLGAMKMLREGVDFVYPYQWGYRQRKVLRDEKLKKFLMTRDFTHIDIDSQYAMSEYGHAFFANTEKYREAFGENENFISWGPEDKERGHRFKTLGYNVKWMEGHIVYHIEHSRGKDSWTTNPYFKANNELWETMKKYNKIWFKRYYNKQTYLEKYLK